MKTFIGIIALAACVSAFAIAGALQSQSVNGFLRYCKYSNGVIITVNTYELCPIWID